MEPQFIDTIKALRSFIDGLPGCDQDCPSLYIDLEGNDLCRTGTLSLLTVLVEPRHSVHIVDITNLGNDAFTTTGEDSRSIKSILESPAIIKVFFDIRNDSDALFSHFGVQVAGVEDLQLLELASRRSSKRLVHGLARCIENDADIRYEEKRRSREVKEKGRRLFAPERGGSYAVFDQRPLSEDIKQYCVQDVALMPGLREVYLSKLCDAWWRKIEEETLARIALSQKPHYNGKGRHMALGPPTWLTWSPMPSQWQCKVLINAKGKAARDAQATIPITSLLSEVSTPYSPMTTASVNSPSKNAITSSQSSNEATVRIFAGPTVGSSFTGPKEISGIAKNLDNLDLAHEDGHVDDFEDYDDDRSERIGSSYDSDESWGKDLTACDKECGYCGRCMY